MSPHENNHAMPCDCSCHCSCDEVKLRHADRLTASNVREHATWTLGPSHPPQHDCMFIALPVCVRVDASRRRHHISIRHCEHDMVLHVCICFAFLYNVLSFISAPKMFATQGAGIAMRHMNTCAALDSYSRLAFRVRLIYMNRPQLKFRNDLRGMVVCIDIAMIFSYSNQSTGRIVKHWKSYAEIRYLVRVFYSRCMFSLQCCADDHSSHRAHRQQSYAFWLRRNDKRLHFAEVDNRTKSRYIRQSERIMFGLSRAPRKKTSFTALIFALMRWIAARSENKHFTILTFEYKILF